MTVLAAAIALLGSVFFAFGAALQQFEAITDENGGEGGLLRRLLTLARRPRWLLGGLSITGGGALHIVALSLGPLTVVQPMGVASLLFALPIAAALHGRRPARGEIIAAGAVSAGLIGLVLLVPQPTGTPHLTGPGAVALLAATALLALVCKSVSTGAPPALKAGLLAIGAGVMYGATATLMRAMIEGGPNLWFALAIPVPALTALALLQGAYSTGRFPVAYASVQLADPLTAVTFGALLLGEPLPAGAGGAIAAVAAAAIAGAGTVTLARTTPMPR